MTPEPRFYRPAEFDAAWIAALPARAEPREVLLCEPSHYAIEEALNPHMMRGGALHKADRRAAWAQWEALGSTYARLGLRVHVLAGVRGLPDMVFAANQTLPFVDAEGRRAFVPARMKAPSRRGEVAHYARFLEGRGFRRVDLPFAGKPEGECTLEGTGDCLLLPGRRALLAGIGPRTSEEAVMALPKILDMPVIGLRLQNERFYHLDTCLAPLTERCALVAPDALEPEAVQLLERLFPEMITVPAAEADSPGFACNAHCPDGRHVLLQRGSAATVEALRARGLEPVELDTSEFVKAGGSVFCLKLALP
jgi:N-dimethylarginine dimethylaminohydrolase